MISVDSFWGSTWGLSCVAVRRWQLSTWQVGDHYRMWATRWSQSCRTVLMPQPELSHWHDGWLGIRFSFGLPEGNDHQNMTWERRNLLINSSACSICWTLSRPLRGRCRRRRVESTMHTCWHLSCVYREENRSQHRSLWNSSWACHGSSGLTSLAIFNLLVSFGQIACKPGQGCPSDAASEKIIHEVVIADWIESLAHA